MDTAKVRPGDTVRGSDRGDIGTVAEVVEATEGAEGYLLVRGGLIFKTDTHSPSDAVVRRAGADVFINIPKLLVGEMPWGEPPSLPDRQAKHGPRSADVEKLYGSRSPSIQDPSAEEERLKAGRAKN